MENTNVESARGVASYRQDKSARNKFNVFLNPLGFEEISKLKRRNVTKELIGMFASFLLRDKIGHQTSMNYLSSIKTQLEE
jgi:hypothetical protein